MADIAKLFTTGRSQAVRLPMEYRFEGRQVYIRRDPRTGDVILSRRPPSWDGLFALDASTEVPADFMTEADRAQGRHARDPFDEAARRGERGAGERARRPPAERRSSGRRRSAGR